MKLSIVATLYNSGPYVVEFYQRISKAAQAITDDYEIILVNDGSPDNSLEIAVELHEKDAKVKVIDLSRNFGHHKAMMTGLDHAIGERIFLIDSDLEEPPELLQQFWEKLDENECDVVYGVQETRKGNVFERVTGALFYSIAYRLTDIKLPHNMSTVRLMTKRYVKSLVSHQECEVIIAGLWIATGYKQIPLKFKKKSIKKSDYGIIQKLNLATDFLTAFSGKLLYFVFYLGMSISLLSLVYIGFTVLNYFVFNTIVSGWTSLIVSIWLIGGMLILFVGLIGIYIARIFNETKNRPYTLVRHIYAQDKTYMQRSEE